MFALSRKCMLAIEAVVDIAHHGRAGPVPSREFAERLKISRRHLEPVLQALVRNGVLKSLRGPRGGYVLARERRKVSLGDIIRASDGDADGAPSDSSAMSRQIIDPVVAGATAEAVRALDEVALSDILSDAEQRGLLAEVTPPQDFTI